MAKKRFGIDQITSSAISQTLQMVKNHDSNFSNTEIVVSNIELDVDNPRKHYITVNDLRDGLKRTDPYFEVKQNEYEGLVELSNSIKKDGLLHPIIVFKHGDKYRLVSGERRFLASLIAQKNQIEARVFKEKPSLFDLKIIQWVENDARKDISLHKKLLNIQSIISIYESNKHEKISALILSDILCISRSLCHQYISILNNYFLMELVSEGVVTHLRTARALYDLTSKAEILEKLSKLEKKNKKEKIIKHLENKKKLVGPKRKKVNFGNSKNSFVVKEIVDSVLTSSKYQKYSTEFEHFNWNSFDDSTRAFQKLVKILEKHMRE